MQLPLVHPGDTICDLDEIADGGSLKFLVLEAGRPIEAFLVRFDGACYAYKNRCAHMALTLDLDDNDFFTIDGRSLICKTHGAVYRPQDGFCYSGPCMGEALDPLRVDVQGGSVVLRST